MNKPRILGKSQIPIHYDIFINLSSKEMVFEGRLKFKLKLTKPCHRITLHSKNLKIKKPTIKKVQKNINEIFTVNRINFHKKFQEVRLHCDKKLFPGDYVIELDFSGDITENMTGLYPCKFSHKGEEKIILATQFESNHAREVFPCIDEPAAKAIFKLSLETESTNVCLSNMTQIKEKISSSRKIVEFDETPVMSSYLLAFVCGDLHYVEKLSSNGTPVRSWSAINRPKSQLNYSVTEAVRILDYFESYFKTNYPLQKLDQIALPDFDAGAMENWGLITYREIALLADEKNRSISNEQYISLVIAHELSHQWFGNLVTMKWWDDLWLNESFASLMEHIALDAIHPEWKQWEHFTSSDIISTTSRDIYKDIQPICVEISDPELIETLFDPGIVYAKGSRLLKMLRELIGDDVFRSGLERYFKNYAYSNTSRNDLWLELTKASNRDIALIMNPWLLMPGMPVIRIDQDKKDLNLSQSRFMLDSPSDNTVWPIPLLANKELIPDVFSKRNCTIKLKNEEFIVLNQFASAHYFCHYVNPDHFEFLKNQFSEKKLSTESRINFINDLLLLSKNNLAPLTDALDLISKSVREDRDCVWAMISRVVAVSSQLSEDNKKCEEGLKKLKLHLADYNFNLLGINNKQGDDPNTIQLRHTIFSLMVGGEDQYVINKCHEIYNSTSSLNQLPAETRSTILSAVVRHSSDDKVVLGLLDKYRFETPEIQLDITSALLTVKKPRLAELIYSTALGKNGFVRPQDLMKWIALGIRNFYIRENMWSFLENNWKWIEGTIGQSKSFDYLPIYCSSVITKKDELQRFNDFFKTQANNKSLERNIKIGISDAKTKIQWRKREEDKIEEFLKLNSFC